MPVNIKEFALFIRNILEYRGGVEPEYLSGFLVPDAISKFRVAFTHKTINPTNNYEVYEFLGDGVIGEFVPSYIKWRYPYIVNVNWLHKLKAYLIGKKFLARIAADNDFATHISYKGGIESLDVRSAEYLSTLEDVVEALMGCIVEVAQDNGLSHATGLTICRNILKSFFNNQKISTQYEVIFDAITRLKQLYELRGRLKWPYKQAYDIQYVGNDFVVKVYGWPKGDKTVKKENEELLAKASGKTKDEAKQKAAEAALEVLKSTYHIFEVPIDSSQR